MFTEIVVIGNEILTGHTLDTNSNWMCKKITAVGGEVRRITKVRDEIAEIADVIRNALSRKPDFIITTGGLGPTFDDKTAHAIGVALNRKIVLNEDAFRMVQRRYKELYEQGAVDTPDMLPERKKMAMLPEGAIIIDNFVGTAPGIQIIVDDTVIIALPGVPAEMKEMFERAVLPQIQKKTEGLVFISKEIEIDLHDESVLAPIVDKIMQKYENRVFIKSHPSTYGSSVKIKVEVRARGKNREEINELVDNALNDVSKEVSKLLRGVGQQ